MKNWPETQENTVREMLQRIQALALNTATRRVHADGALETLLERITHIGVVAKSEEQAIAAYDAGFKAIDRMVMRILRGKPL
jgi:hypothetical protein